MGKSQFTIFARPGLHCRPASLKMQLIPKSPIVPALAFVLRLGFAIAAFRLARPNHCWLAGACASFCHSFSSVSRESGRLVPAA